MKKFEEWLMTSPRSPSTSPGSGQLDALKSRMTSRQSLLLCGLENSVRNLSDMSPTSLRESCSARVAVLLTLFSRFVPNRSTTSRVMVTLTGVVALAGATHDTRAPVPVNDLSVALQLYWSVSTLLSASVTAAASGMVSDTSAKFAG